MTNSDDLDHLVQRAEALADVLLRPSDGAPGRDGKDGASGRDVDPEIIRSMVAVALADMPLSRHGRDGLDADPEVIRAQVERAVRAITVKDGARGPRGPDGPMGPMPAHQWDGSRLRFEQQADDGTIAWGKWVDLRGPRGYVGPAGGSVNDIDLSAFPPALEDITPDFVLVSQQGKLRRMAWQAFVDLVGPTVPIGETYAIDYADEYTRH